MKILVAINSFKTSISSSQINDIVSKTLTARGFQVYKVNVSDGGDGFIDCFRDGSFVVRKKVTGPFYNMKVNAEYLINRDEAFIEVANITGIKYLKKDELNPLYATSYGVGEIIKDAIRRNVRKIYIGLGGTASNDGGFQMARALGARFLDERGYEVENSIYGLLKLKKIDFSNFIDLNNIRFYAISDVKNKLLGRYGSARVFGPQKGADSEGVRLIEKALLRLTCIIKKQKNKDISKIAGGAASGGLGAGIYGFLNGKIISGSEFIINRFNIKSKISEVDLVITGEGKLDRSSFYGKITGELIKLSLKLKKRVIFITVVNEYGKSISGVDVIELSQKYGVRLLYQDISNVVSYEIKRINL